MAFRAPRRPSADDPGSDAEFDPYTAAVQMLARRELSVKQLRARLLQRTGRADEVEAAIERLRANGSLDDERVATAYARTAAHVKGRGRDRILRELSQMGIAQATARRAVDEVANPAEERDRLQRALVRRAKGIDLREPAAMRRVFAALIRQGFDPEHVQHAMRALQKGEED
jgi:regulatory protein